MHRYTLSAPVRAEIDIKKSRFLGVVLPVADRAAALACIESLRREHRGAAHVCWALLAGGESGMSDDGEPSGTAGRPILEVLRHHELDGVLGAVVRYYGGIKLGAGGLVRAYGDAVATALKEAQVIERVPVETLRIGIGHADEARVRHWLQARGYALARGESGEDVLLLAEVPVSEGAAARAALGELTRGRCIVA